ncbi:MAG: carbohydrate ABC transporter permease [Oscillospiraceae bacterium]
MAKATVAGGNTSFRSQSTSDKAFDVVNTLIMVLLVFVFAWPLLFVLSASVSDPNAVWTGQVILLPKGLNINGYIEILKYKDIWVGYRNTLFYTIVGTAVNLVMTVCAAYPLSRPDFMLRRPLTLVFMFTMYFSGGLIPTYLIVQKLGLINSPWAIIIPSAVSIYNVIITRTYFENSIPDSLREASELDGANSLQFLIRIVLPLSGPILAVMGLYYGVGRWNSYFDALIYLNNKEMYPLQMFLRDILIQNKMQLDLPGLDPVQAVAKKQLGEIMKYAMIVVATVPVLCVYPFIQKHFVKGVMIGAIKG